MTSVCNIVRYWKSSAQPANRGSGKKYEIVFDCQSGFRNKHSANTSLTNLSNNKLKEFKARKLSDMIFTDLQKAFDTLDHEILKYMKYMI